MFGDPLVHLTALVGCTKKDLATLRQGSDWVVNLNKSSCSFCKAVKTETATRTCDPCMTGTTRRQSYNGLTTHWTARRRDRPAGFTDL
jgi:hypothetical protein